MYNSKKNLGDMEPSQLPARKPTIYEHDKDAGTKLTDYKMICELGRGSYGVVNRVLSLINGNEYVMKKINMKHVKLNHQKEALKEAQILKKVRHSNIIRYYTSFVEDEHLYIIMEYAENGDLGALIKSHREQRKPFTEKQIWDFAWELCQAIDYMHSNNIIHRDIKALNVFLSKDGHIKLGDLGVSKIVSSAAALQGTRVGTPLYLAPELVKQLPYDFKVDIWALGCVLYHLATLEAPFTGDNLISLGYNIVHKAPKALPATYSPKLTALIMKFLEKAPVSRPKISEIWSYFPSKYRTGSKGASEPNENSQPSITNKVEYHTNSAAQLLKIDEKDLAKSKVDKQLTHWGSSDKAKSQLPPPTRPQTAHYSSSSYKAAVQAEEKEKEKGGKITMGSQLCPSKVSLLSQQNEKSRNITPFRQTPGVAALVEAVNADAAAPADNENIGQVSRREQAKGVQEKKNQQVIDEKEEEVVKTVENKPKPIQIASSITDNPTLVPSQIKDTENAKKSSRKEEPNQAIQQSTRESKVPVSNLPSARETPKPQVEQPVQSGVETKNKKEQEVKVAAPVVTPVENKPKQGSEAVQVVQVAPFHSRDIQSQGQLQRPATADPRKLLMNPLINSASPRFKINSKITQMPSLSNFARPNGDGMLNVFTRPETANNNRRTNAANNIRNLKEEMNDSSESIEVLDDLKKKANSQNAGNGIRIRPVSAHILKSMQNQLAQPAETRGIANKDYKSVANIEKESKVEAQKAVATEGSDKEKDDKGAPRSRTSSVERPKSALVGRLAPKALQVPKDQSGAIGRNNPAFDAYMRPGYGEWLQKGSIGSLDAEKERERVSRFFQTGDKLGNSKHGDVLKEEREELEDYDDDRKINHKDLLRRNASYSSVRIEVMGKSLLKSSADVTRKTETTEDWSLKEDELKGVKRQGAQVRPTTASGPKKKLTIHDLK